jgi:hypothetical protein
MKNYISIFSVLCFLFPFSSSFGVEKKVVVIASGETHAMLLPCDCPTEPGGGFAKRASMVTLLRDTNDVLLVDAGGFAGGNMYDPYTEGRVVDSLRTMAAIRGIGYMKYDAVSVGDDDLQYGAQWLARQAFYGKVPLVSANCFYANGKPFTAPYVVVKKGRYSFGITGVTTEESLFPGDSSIVVKPPIPMLKAIWKNLKASSDIQIILAHLGEPGSRQLLDTFPDCALVVNGHRKTSAEEFISDRGQVMLQFGFQGKALSFAEIVTDSKGPAVGKTGWIGIVPSVPEDSTMSKLVALPEVYPGKNALQVFDLYIMSRCRFGCSALREFTAFIQLFPSVQWQVWFIGSSYIDGSVTSLHGQPEINDELLWLAVQAQYPGKWLSFLEKRSASTNVTTESVVRDMGMDYAKLKAWIAKKGMDELRRHYSRSMRMGINASPTLLINNTVFQQDVTSFNLSKITCGRSAKRFAYCDSLPECGTDADCRKTGKIGACVSKSGKKPVCEFKDAPRFTLTVVVSDSALFHPERNVLSDVQNDFPGVVIDSITSGSERGKGLIREYDPLFLPVFLFDKAIENAANYSSFSQGLVLQKSTLVFKNGMFKPSYFYKRKLLPGTVELYVDPLFPGALEAIRIAMHPGKAAPVIAIKPNIFTRPDSSGLSAEEILRHEEALRWLVLRKNYPGRFNEYLALFCARKNMSYWFTDCKKLGIDVDEFVKKVQADSLALRVYWKELDQLGMKEPVEVLISNREVVSVKNPKELTDILQKTR